MSHGLFGFGSQLWGLNIAVPSRVGYYRGLRDSINTDHLKILEPSVPAVGSIKQRAAEFTEQVLAQTHAEDSLYVIGHSMGGLDFLQAYADSAELRTRIKGVACIATPFLGSEVADALINPQHKLANLIPPALSAVLRHLGPALVDLSSTQAPANTALNTPMLCPAYLIAGNGSSLDANSALFKWIAKLGQYAQTKTGSDINDGVVTQVSAHYPATLNTGWKTLPDWPLDHGAEIGWSFESLLNTDEHLARYHQVIALLTGKLVEDFRQG